MTKLSNLSKDLLEEILSRVPVKSTRQVRSTCKKWNTLSKEASFTKKHLAQSAAAAAREGEFLVIVLIKYSLYLMSVSLYGTLDYSDPSVKPLGKLINPNHSDEVAISQVFYCEGLLLCTMEDYTRVVVWNPYTGQTQWICIEPTSAPYSQRWYSHALGYDKSKSCRTHKILRFTLPHLEGSAKEIYDLNSNSWRVLDVTPDSEMELYVHGVSLKGDTYWVAQEDIPPGRVEREINILVEFSYFLICFDFTTESFGPRLPLPFHSYGEETVTLCSVREEQLGMLFQRWGSYDMEIWVTAKIEPSAVSWRKFSAVNMTSFIGFRYGISESFLIDEEKRAVVVFDEDKDRGNSTRKVAYIIQENGYFREVDLGVIRGGQSFPLAWSYVPSSVQISSNLA